MTKHMLAGILNQHSRLYYSIIYFYLPPLFLLRIENVIVSEF